MAKNPWALAFLRKQPWGRCAEGTDGLRVLKSHNDDKGDFWYPVSKAGEVRQAYSTCSPICATAKDS
eukprot:CAMPEP_0169437764 /NCGR_PEP_ID=MMETSP1042-20121227/6300_1 /TAXON_ID=464988 /ORGANISM="Hemiselmis andersenii, Strain CCMP1180" /LENGTH=66 /DNA_ID=CAMNT_0009548555 /DNA_START=348 /DNA_END=544 /DNA_ORIENTATION=-